MPHASYPLHYVAQPLHRTLTAFSQVSGEADTAPYFTGVDQVALMAVTPFMRTLLDDPDAEAAQTTLGLGQAGASTFLGLSDTPETYAGQAGKTLLVAPAETGLVFGTVPPPAPAESRFLLIGV